MFSTNQRTDKLAAVRVDFTDRGMLEGSCLSDAMQAFLSLALGDDELDSDELEDGEFEEEQPEGNAIVDGGDSEEDGAVEGPKVLGDVSLAKRPGA